MVHNIQTSRVILYVFYYNLVYTIYILFLLKDMTDRFCIVLYNIFWEKITMSYVCVDSLIDMFPFLTADFCGMCALLYYIVYRITALFPHYIIIFLYGIYKHKAWFIWSANFSIVVTNYFFGLFHKDILC